jgi:hypothetical protein
MCRRMRQNVQALYITSALTLGRGGERAHAPTSLLRPHSVLSLMCGAHRGYYCCQGKKNPLKELQSSAETQRYDEICRSVAGKLRGYEPSGRVLSTVRAEDKQRERRQREIDRDQVPHAGNDAGMKLINNRRFDRPIKHIRSRNGVARCTAQSHQTACKDPPIHVDDLVVT